MRAVILARVSDEDQKKALPAQLERLHAYVEKKQFELVKEYEFDETAFSTKKRKKFSAILREIETMGKKERIALVADKVDRLLRDIPTLVRVGELVMNDVVELHFANDNLFVDKNMSAHDDFRLGLAALLARFYSKSSSDNIKRIFSYLKKQGVLLTKAPFGYKNIIREDRSKWVIPNPNTEAALISEYDWRLEGCEYKIIKKKLKEQYGIVRAMSSVERDLRNPFYGGYICDEKTGELYAHKYDAVVPYEKYEAVQKMGKRKYMPREHSYLFSGYITCDYCGSTVTSYAASKYKGTEKEKIYLRCKRTNDEKCTNPPLNEQDAIKQIADILKTFTLTDEDIQKIVAYIAKAENNQEQIHKATIKSLDQEAARLEQEMADVSARADKYGLPAELVKKEIDKLKSDWYGVKSTRKLEEGKGEQNLALVAEKVLQTAKNAHLIFVQSSSISEKRELLKNLVEPLKLRDRKLLIRLKPQVSKFFRTQNEKMVELGGVEPPSE
jgi:DNA invertase Pin-like site-specific DNA recombinase